MGHKHTGVHTCAVLSPSIFHISHSNIFTADLLRTAATTICVTSLPPGSFLYFSLSTCPALSSSVLCPLSRPSLPSNGF